MNRIDFSSKSVFVFDWDGTILDSMDIKARNFARALSSTLKRQTNAAISFDGLVELYRRFSGRPRQVVLRSVLTSLDLDLEPMNLEVFDQSFTAENKVNLAQAPVFEDAQVLLDFLVCNNWKVCISSSVPQIELEYFVSSKLPERVTTQLLGVLGSATDFNKGADHVKYIEKRTALERESFLVIGDDEADFELCSEAGVDFLMINRGGKVSRKPYPIVDNLLALKRIVES